MPVKNTDVKLTVSADRRLPVDPDHGLHVPDAAALAANGVKTAGHHWREPGEDVTVAPAVADTLEVGGIIAPA